MTAADVLVLDHTAAAWFGAGFIGTMQLVNYPLLAEIGDEGFVRYERAHNRRFALVVGPPVVVVAAALVLAVIVLTATLRAPAHGRFAQGFDAAVLRRLVLSNWARTAAWTLLGLLDLWMLVQIL